jgi:ABC-type siderophore export system fused ATPase/permease subunit
MSLQFEDIYFEHVDDVHGKIFSLGPVNLEFKEGELVFLIGGNGSGKSTFLNILTGLLKPLRGNIYYNDEMITDDLYTAYRDKIAAVFSDGYLLRNNYEDFELNGMNERFIKYLKLMKLEGVVPRDDVFELKSSLSKGQQKRLLLILSLLMDKKILVWDEWEAEQDPAFKEYFYKYVIPFLRNEGKTIIAITHDDRYLSCADKIIRFRDGKIVCSEPLITL